MRVILDHLHIKHEQMFGCGAMNDQPARRTPERVVNPPVMDSYPDGNSYRDRASGSVLARSASMGISRCRQGAAREGLALWRGRAGEDLAQRAGIAGEVRGGDRLLGGERPCGESQYDRRLGP